MRNYYVTVPSVAYTRGETRKGRQGEGKRCSGNVLVTPSDIRCTNVDPWMKVGVVYPARGRPINGCLHARKGEEEKVEEFNRGIPVWKRDRTRFNAVCLWMCIYVDGISLNRLGCKCNLETARDYVMGEDRLWK